MPGASMPDIPDEILVAIADYLDNTLSPERKKEVEDKIANDPEWKKVHDDMLDTTSAPPLSGLQQARADVKFDDNVTDTIHKRSAGRFFGRKTLGDRVPFGAILVLAMIGLVLIAYVLWASQTGSLKVHDDPKPKQGSNLIDKP